MKLMRLLRLSLNFAPALLSLLTTRSFSTRREHLVALASRHSVPTIYPFREFAMAGGLISYGPSLSAVYHLLGTYAGKILAGANPAELPVQRPTALDLVINLKTD